ncbi:MAG: methyltransferase domain-containing protein [Pseudomonadota bacterium]|nr:methyltransferase domain-containing protein [Pseudomonadota bacterium]
MKKYDALPPYMDILFNKLYKNKIFSGVCDDERIVKLAHFGLHKKIITDLLRDVSKNAHVLQIGLTFGSEIEMIYQKVKKQGKLDIFDVSETQLSLAGKKYGRKNIELINYNAALSWDEKYDVIICYNLLHELPLQTRRQVMDNVLNSLTRGGKAVFVDFARPVWWHPLRFPLLWFNRLYRPFAESLWQEPLENFCSEKEEFRWQHSYYGGKLLQKTIAVPKILSNEDVKKLTKLFRNR